MKQIKSTSKHRWLGILILIFLAVIFSCSTVFTASIQGKVMLRYVEETEENEEVKYEEKEKDLKNVLVFLYDSKEKWDADFNFYNSENPNETLPNSPEKENYLYYQMTETNTQGEFSFNGFMWQTNNPEIGRASCRERV